ncbi:hypothetical protein HDU89_008691 [Geranomyces variabilis]|nr:hypothetical protein HDU89_008691 [Geranomyces variabilis]
MSKDPTCPICYNFPANYCTPCGHLLCLRCIKKIMFNGRECPQHCAVWTDPMEGAAVVRMPVIEYMTTGCAHTASLECWIEAGKFIAQSATGRIKDSTTGSAVYTVRNGENMHVRFFDVNNNTIRWKLDPAGMSFWIAIDDGAGADVVIVSGFSTHGLCRRAPGAAFAPISPAGGALVPAPGGQVRGLHFVIGFPAAGPTPGGAVIWEGRDLRRVAGQSAGNRATYYYVRHIDPINVPGHASRRTRAGYMLDGFASFFRTHYRRAAFNPRSKEG